jgi:hypothetical protein
MEGRKRAGYTVLGLLWVGAVMAQGELDLVPPEAGYFRPEDPVSVQLPADMPPGSLQQLSVELDGIDVTSFVTVEADKIVYRPPQPLGFGAHQLRVVEYQPDGNIVERALFSLEVRKNAAFREAEANVDTTLSATWRVADQHVDSTIARSQQQAGANLNGRIADGSWQARSDIGLIFNSQRDQTANQRKLDLASGLVEASRGPVAVRAGDHMIAGSSFVMDSFSRRGLSGSVQLDRMRSQLTGFAMRTENSSGFWNWPGVSDNRHRTDGITLSSAPLAVKPERLQIAATYLDGEGSTVGTSTAGVDESVSGRATDLVIDSLTWEQRVRLRGEYASARTDFDGTGALEAVTDDAWGMLAVYQHPQTELRGSAFNWNVGAEHKLIGPWFFSLGNTALATDKLLNQAFGGFNWGGWSVNTLVARETDNVNDEPNIPRLRSDYVTLGSSYAATTQQEKTGFMRLFSQPYLTFLGQHVARRHTDIPVGYGGDRIDDNTDAVSVRAQFVPGSWSWDFGHTRTWFNDAANLQPDYISDVSDLGAALPLSDRFSLTPRVQFQTTDDHDNDVVTRNLALQAGVQYAVIQNRLNTSLDYSLIRQWADNSADSSNTYVVSATVDWIVAQPRGYRPGLSLFTMGSYQNDLNVYQIFAGLRLGSQLTY